MLKLPLPALAHGDARLEEEIAADDPLWTDLEIRPAAPVHVDVRGSSVGDGVLVRGHVRARFQVPCRRCLEDVPVDVNQPVHLLFVPGDGDEEDFGGEVYPLPARGTELDLAEAIREQVVLGLPRFVVCRDECRGLCAHCGANRNQGECGCTAEVAPSPWDALKNLERKPTD